jgi:hypothetical protein
MNPIDETQAREHIAMVDRILAHSQQRLCGGGEFFVVWGIGSAAVTTIFASVDAGVLPSNSAWWAWAVLVLCVAFSIVRSRQNRHTVASSSLVQREFFNVLWITLGLAFVADVAAFHIFQGVAAAAIWSVAEAIVLLYIGLHGNRRALVCGVLIIVSLIVANFVSGLMPAYVLAAGMLAGYGGFGLSELLARD